MTEFNTDGGPEWPERLTRFCEWEWTEEEILEAATDYAKRHAEINNLAEPLPPDAWSRHMEPLFAYSHFRRKWALENGRMQDIVDGIIRRRLERQRLYFVEEDEET